MSKLRAFLFFFSILFSLTSKPNEWKQVFDKDGIIIYAKDVDGLIPFKAVGYINGTIDEILAVIQDYKKKHEWSPKLKSVKLHQKISETEYIFSEYYKTPWPAFDREFLLTGIIEKKSKSLYLIKAYSIDNEKLKNKRHVQADVETLDLTLEQVSPKKAKITFEFYGDMKGWMPVWLINIIQKKWPYRFIEALKKRVENSN